MIKAAEVSSSAHHLRPGEFVPVTALAALQESHATLLCLSVPQHRFLYIYCVIKGFDEVDRGGESHYLSLPFQYHTIDFFYNSNIISEFYRVIGDIFFDIKGLYLSSYSYNRRKISKHFILFCRLVPFEFQGPQFSGLFLLFIYFFVSLGRRYPFLHKKIIKNNNK